MKFWIRVATLAFAIGALGGAAAYLMLGGW